MDLAEWLQWKDDLFATTGQTVPRYLKYKEKEISTELFDLFQKTGINEVSDLKHESFIELDHRIRLSENTKLRHLMTSFLHILIRLMCEKGMLKHGFALMLEMKIHSNLLLSWISLNNNELKQVQEIQIKETQRFAASEILKLRDMLVSNMKVINYVRTIVSKTKSICNALYIFLEANGLEYSKGLGNYWLDHWKGRLNLRYYNGVRHVLGFLNDYSEGKELNLLTHRMGNKRKLQRLPEWCKDEAIRYIRMKEEAGYARSSIDMFESSVSRFLFYVDSIGIRSFQDLNTEIILGFNLADKHRTIEGKNAYNSRIRDFLMYLAEIKVVPQNLFLALRASTAIGTRIVEILSPDQKEEINQRIKQRSLSARDIAMMELGLHLGLRRIDIVNLKIEDIDWKEGMLRFVQQKTLKEIQLAMPVSVANAIYRYIVEERPESRDRHIFLSQNVPYRHLNPSVCGDCIQHALPERKSSGFHITRKTFATDCLKRNANIMEIKELLGHQDLNNLHKYLSRDEQRMRECALSLTDCQIQMKEPLRLWTGKK